jgi:hypothetical protein
MQKQPQPQVTVSWLLFFIINITANTKRRDHKLFNFEKEKTS